MRSSATSAAACERSLGEDELDLVEAEELLELAGDRVLRLGQDADEVFGRERRQGHDDRQATDELGDEPELEQVLGHEPLEDLAPVDLRDAGLGAESDRALPDPLLDDLLQSVERAAADEQHVRRVDLDEVLVGMLAAALRRNIGDGALEDLEERLLDALTGHVPRDRGVVRLARDLVDLVDVDDPALGAGDVEVGGLDEPQQDVLDVLADVAGLGQRGGVGDAEGHIQDAGQRLREERLARARRADEEHVRLLELDVVDRMAGVDPLVVVVDRDREDLLGLVLADHVLVERELDLPGVREAWLPAASSAAPRASPLR